MSRPAQRLDACGDPLPAGMRLRIGSSRLTWDWDAISLAASHDGSLLAVGSTEGWVSVWDSRSGDRVHRMRSRSVKGRRNVWRVEHLCFSPDAFMLVSSCGGFVTCWDLGTGKPRWEARLYSDFSLALAFSPDGSKLATGSPVQLLDAATGTSLTAVPECAPNAALKVNALAFTEDGSTLVAGRGSTLTAVRLDDPRVVRSLELPVPPGVSVSAFSNWLVLPATCGTITTVAHCAGGLHEVDLARMALLHSRPWPEHTVAPGREEIALGRAPVVVTDRTPHRLNAEGPWVRLEGPPTSACALSGDGTVLALARCDGASFIDVYDGDSSVPRHDIPRVTGPIAFGSHEGQPALIAPCPGRLLVLEPATGAPLGTRPYRQGHLLDLQLEAGRAVLREPGDHDSVRDLDGKLLAAAGDEGSPRLVSPDGQSWVSKSVKYRDERLFLCGLDGTRTELWRGCGPSYALAFSPDGQRLAAGFYSEPGRIWDTRTRQCLGTIPQTYIWSMGWLADGARLLCGAHGGKAGIWDPARNEWEVEVDCGRKMVHSVAWAPGGERFATSGQTVQIWSRGGAPLETIRSSGDLLFTPDGHGLSVQHGGLIEIWELS